MGGPEQEESSDPAYQMEGGVSLSIYRRGRVARWHIRREMGRCFS
jgi:hypothetical protein